jgi:hypothetical protein
LKLLVFDEQWCAKTLKLTGNNTIIEKNNSTHGIVFTKLQLNQYHPYIEFKIDMKVASCGSSHLFIGVLDKSKYVTENLSKNIITKYFLI